MKKTGLFFAIAGSLIGCMSDGSTEAELRVDQLEITANGQAYFVRGELGRVDGDLQAPDLSAAMPGIGSTLGVAADTELRVKRVEHDSLGMTHVRITQHKNGLPVVSGDAIVHVDRDGVIRSVDSSIVDRDLTASPSLAAADAAQIAVRDTKGQNLTAQSSELVYVVSNRDNELYLAWQVRVVGNAEGLPLVDLVYVDALGDRVVDRHPRIFTAKTRTITNGNGGTFPVAGAPTIGTEAQPPTDQTGLAAFTNTGLTYDCYKTLFNRDSYDGNGAPLNSQVHVVFDNGDGTTSPDNAVWAADVAMMAYGDGDGTQMTPLAFSLDVTAHELTHAVTSATSDLVYQNESGALNESMSDIFGAVCQAFHAGKVDASTFLVGEDIWTPNTPGDALRYMDNPTIDGYSADNYAERLQITTDAGGVHGNSGISNLAFYLLTNGGKHPRSKTNVTVPAIEFAKAAQIFHRAQTTKMTANTTFAQARTTIEQSAEELYPGTCAKTATSLAFAAVGVGAPPPPDTAPPTVAIASPADGARVSSGFQVQVNTSDDQCINKVELLIDGTVVQTVTEAPYTFTAPTTLASGAHDIVVKSYDAFNSSTSTSHITLSGGGGGGGGGDGGGDDGDISGGCNTGAGGSGGLMLLLGLGLVLRRRSR